MKRFGVILFLVVVHIDGFTQSSIYYESLTEKIGLPSSECYKVHQSTDKNIWILSNAGILKYDGTVLKSYHIEDSNFNSSTFYTLSEDSKGRTWVCNEIGETYIFSKKNDNFEKYRFSDEVRDSINGFIYQIKHCEDSTIFYPTRNDKKVFIDVQGVGKWVYPESLFTNHAFADIKNQSLSYNNDKTNFYDWDLNRSYYGAEITNVNGRHLSFIRNTIIELNGNSAQPVYIFKNIIRKIFVVNKSTLLTLTEKSLIEVNLTNGTQNELLNNIQPTDITKGSDFNFWLTSETKGLIKIPNIHIKKYHEENSIVSLNRSSRKILFSTRAGDLISIDTNRAFDYKLNSSSQATNSLNVKVAESTDKTSIYFHSDGPCYYNGNAIIEIERIISQQGETLYGNKKGISLSKITYLHKDTLISSLGQGNGLRVFKVNRLKKELILLKQLNIRMPKIQCITLFRNRILLGTKRGIWELHKNLKSVKLVDSNGFDLVSLSSISDLEVFQNRNLFVCTQGEGFFSITKDTSYNLSIKSGLSNDYTNSISIDDNQNIWVTTNYGLNQLQFDQKGKSYKVKSNYFKEDGFITNYLEQIETIGDYLFISTNQGLIIANRMKIEREYPLNNIAVELFSTNQSLIKPKQVLDFENNSLEIKIQSKIFTKPYNYLYRYKITQDQNSGTFQYTNASNINLVDLSPGQYKLEFQGQNRNYKWSNAVFREFTIADHYFNSRRVKFFIIGGALLISFGLSYLFYVRRSRDRALNNFKNLEISSEKSKLQSLSSQMNPHFFFNALNSVQLLVMTNDIEGTNEYVHSLANLTRSALEISREKNILLTKELDFIEKYIEIENLRNKTEYPYILKIKNKLKELDDILIPPMFIHPFVENCVKHAYTNSSEKKIITISIKIVPNVEDIIQFTIEDQGVGFSQSKSKSGHKSIAIDIMKKRISIINRNKKHSFSSLHFHDLGTPNKSASGAQVIVQIPFEKQNIE